MLNSSLETSTVSTDELDLPPTHAFIHGGPGYMPSPEAALAEQRIQQYRQLCFEGQSATQHLQINLTHYEIAVPGEFISGLEGLFAFDESCTDQKELDQRLDHMQRNFIGRCLEQFVFVRQEGQTDPIAQPEKCRAVCQAFSYIAATYPSLREPALRVLDHLGGRSDARGEARVAMAQVDPQRAVNAYEQEAAAAISQCSKQTSVGLKSADILGDDANWQLAGNPFPTGKSL
ncbi:MAG TPA: hypothetical protein VJK52_01765 [Candidatus Nanoarchaeia archaeon]|nr:hypothetical protein [Candidatus Nanoarchaeia archaeon]